MEPYLKLKYNWTLWFHNPSDSNWGLDSYKKVKKVSNIKLFWELFNIIDNTLVENSMLFFMKNDIVPLWEDAQNKKGGCWSFKIYKNNVFKVWEELCIRCIAQCLTKNSEDGGMINGISISPKKSFCIIKIWLKNCTMQNPSQLTSIPGLSIHGCLFKRHKPEF